MLYGDLYGGYFGGPAPEVLDAGQIAVDRLPDCDQARTKFVAMTRQMGDRWQALEFFIASAQPSFFLDYERGHGVWLDLVGAYLRVPRGTRDDAYYRTVLAAYAKIVWPRRRYLPGLLEALAEIAGDPALVSYVPNYPMGFTVGVAGTGIGSYQASDIVDITRKALPACYNAYVTVEAIDPFLWGDSSATITVDSSGWADATGTISVGDDWSSVTAV